jgi:hypothetical protein
VARQFFGTDNKLYHASKGLHLMLFNPVSNNNWSPAWHTGKGIAYRVEPIIVWYQVREEVFDPGINKGRKPAASTGSLSVGR